MAFQATCSRTSRGTFLTHYPVHITPLLMTFWSLSTDQRTNSRPPCSTKGPSWSGFCQPGNLSPRCMCSLSHVLSSSLTCPAGSSTWNALLPHYLENFYSSLKKYSRATCLVRFSFISDKLSVLPPPGGPLVHVISSLLISIFFSASNGLLRTGPQLIHLCNVCSTQLRHYTGQVLKESLLIKYIWQKFSDYVFNCPRIPQRYLWGNHKADGKADWVEFQKSKQGVIKKESMNEKELLEIKIITAKSCKNQ